MKDPALYLSIQLYPGSVRTVSTALTIISSHNHVQDRRKNIKTFSPNFFYHGAYFFPRSSLGDLLLSPDGQKRVTHPSLNQIAARVNGVGM